MLAISRVAFATEKGFSYDDFYIFCSWPPTPSPTILPFSSQAQTLLAQTLPSKFAPCHIRSRPKRSQALNAQRKTHPPSCTPPILLCQSVCQRVFCASSDWFRHSWRKGQTLSPKYQP